MGAVENFAGLSVSRGIADAALRATPLLGVKVNSPSKAPYATSGRLSHTALLTVNLAFTLTSGELLSNGDAEELGDGDLLHRGDTLAADVVHVPRAVHKHLAAHDRECETKCNKEKGAHWKQMSVPNE